MKSFSLSPVPPVHLNQVHTLVCSEEKNHLLTTLGFIPVIHDIHRQTFGDPDFEPALFLGAYDKQELIGCSMAVHRFWKERKTHIGFIKFIAVEQRLRRKGIGSELLRTCELLLRQKGLTTLMFGCSSPLYWFPGVPEHAIALQKLLEKECWQQHDKRISIFTRLADTSVTERTLTALEQRNPRYRLHLGTIHDRPAIESFVRREFSDSWALEVHEAFANPQAAFCSILKDAQTGDITGFASVNGTNPNWFGPMGVRSDLRRSGLGHLLVCHCLVTARQRGMSYLLIPWINGKETFYTKFLTTLHWQTYLPFEKNISVSRQ